MAGVEDSGGGPDGAEAVERVREHRPDLAFLDITMPVQNGIAAAMEIDGLCPVVFVTAYDQYAIKAFEEGAVDYLLKPVEDERLLRTRQRWEQRQLALPSHWQASLQQLSRQLARPDYLRWIKASVGNSLRMISTSEVLFFQSDEKYTRVQTAGCEALIRMPIKELLQALDPDEFWQIHRSHPGAGGRHRTDQARRRPARPVAAIARLCGAAGSQSQLRPSIPAYVNGPPQPA
ncbi:LytTR family DNA-binding domain-containing protein [Chromobacterium haemolyticum]|nr:LytTR family DNA-binding domain-containing protein [Chromobacterium haemolyticum]